MDKKILLDYVMDPNKFTTFTICSPLKNNELIDKYKAYYTALGNMVLTPINYGLIEPIDQETDIRNIHEIHNMKIKASDAILVVNHDLYIGRDTMREIIYAIKLHKTVMYTNLSKDKNKNIIFNNNSDYPIYL